MRPALKDASTNPVCEMLDAYIATKTPSSPDKARRSSVQPRPKQVPFSAKASGAGKFNLQIETGEDEEELDMDFTESSTFTDKERFQFDYLLKRDPLYEFFNLTC